MRLLIAMNSNNISRKQLILLCYKFGHVISGPVCTRSDPFRFYQRSRNHVVSFLIRSFETLRSNSLVVSSLISINEISTTAFQFYRITSYPYSFGSDPSTRDFFGIGSKWDHFRKRSHLDLIPKRVWCK